MWGQEDWRSQARVRKLIKEVFFGDFNNFHFSLYSCSPYFKDLLKDNHSQHPIFFFHDISYEILKAILEYMYLGEVHITNDNLKDFIRVAEALQIRGLSKDTSTTVSFSNAFKFIN